MRRLLLGVALVAAVGIVVLGAVLVIAARGEEPGASQPQASVTVVGAGVQPSAHAFGDPVVAELVLDVDPTVADPETIRIPTDFSPYEPAGPAQVERTETGGALRLRYRYPLVCLREGCAPEGPRQVFEFPLGNVVYRFRATPGRATAIVDWQPFTVTSRIGEQTGSDRGWRADVTTLPGVSYRLPPGTLAALLFAGSIAFAGLAAALAWWRLRPPRGQVEPAELEPVRRLTPLEQALALAHEAARNGDPPDRRRALERVARELGTRGHRDLADRARDLAWAAGSASPAAIEQLAAEARMLGNGETP
jgi:hypothetical protein